MFSSKTAVASAGVLTAAVALGLAAPTFSSFLFAEVPRVYGTLSVLLRPPYLYFLINGIIISIVAASRFHSNPVVIQAPVPAALRPPLDLVAQAESLDGHINPVSSITAMEYGDKLELSELQSILASPAAMYGQPEEAVEDVISQSIWLSHQNESKEQQLVDELRSNLATTGMYGQSEEAVEDLISRSIWPPQQTEIKEQKKKPKFTEYEAKSEFDVMRSIIPIPAVITSAETTVEAEDVLSQLIWPTQSTKSNRTLTFEKPLLHSRIGHNQRRSTKTIPEGKAALGVARSKRGETLEGTWKAITDGRAVPLARHLKKSDTWTDTNRQAEEEVRLTRKADTFNERTARRRPPAAAVGGGGSRLHKEPSPGQDELNRRVEAFIKKFNEDMRLQRQDSVQQYIDMINRGSH